MRARWAITAVLASAGVIQVIVPALGKPPSAPDGSYASAGISGAVASMQPVNLPARVARVVEVPGRDGAEAWAIAHTRARQPGWDSDSPEGQLVFLHYELPGGWTIDGPPVDSAGRVANPTVANLAVAIDGEGWATGTSGVMVHHVNGKPWTITSLCPAVTCNDIAGISLRGSGDSLTGYAVGAASTVLALSHGSWQKDTAQFVAASSSGADLVGVAATGNGDGWAVTGSSARDLEMYRRTAQGWTRQLTGKPMFDGPHPVGDAGKTYLSAFGNTVAAAPDGKVWFGGAIYPVDPAHPLGDTATGSSERPFTLRWEGTGTTFTSYCAPQYSLTTSQADASPICDKPLPLGSYDITSLSVLPNGEVFAGGLGLFHYRSGGWFREPDAVGYLGSVSFAASDEGWAAATGDTIGVGSVARSSTITIGHFTRHPETARVARWPQPNTEVLESVAVAPDGQRALAVGANDSTLVFRPGIGWDTTVHVTPAALHAVAWSGPNDGWALGERGAIVHFDGNSYVDATGTPPITSETLFAVTFLPNGRGFAVGSGGVILDFDGQKWRTDPASGTLTKETLYSVRSAGSTVYAVGTKGTALVNTSGFAGGWSAEPTITALAQRTRVAPADLFAVDVLSDGTVVVGGSRSTLLVKEPGGPFRWFSPPIEGTVMDARASRVHGALRLIASVSPDSAKYQGQLVATTKAWLMGFDGTNWHDLDFSHRVTMESHQDSSASRDPAFSVALDPSGTSGWAVGGTRDSLPDDEGHLNTISTSSIYRIDLTKDPSPPNTSYTPDFGGDPGTFNFAFFSETGCGNGLCSMTAGSGPAADTVAEQVQRDINAVAKLNGGPSFTVFGGNGRALGIPEELGEFAGYLSKFDTPLFGAPGGRDLFSSVSSGAVGLPQGAAGGINTGLGGTVKQLAPSNAFYLSQFKDQAKPWGTTGASESAIRPVEDGNTPTNGLARTHYAFDYAPAGKPLARFVVLDTSDGSSTGTGTTQNPNEQQATFLSAALTSAKTANLPVIIVMNVPSSDASQSVARPVLTDSTTFESTVTSAQVSAVFSGFLRHNDVYFKPADTSPVRVPFYVSGTAGAPSQGSKYPSDGYYNAWLLVNVDPRGVNGLTNPQAKVSVRSMPVLESLALHARDGNTGPAGSGLRFNALGRGIDGGGPTGDPAQSRRLYQRFPLQDRCAGPGPGNGTCFGTNAIPPDYSFVSEDPSIAQFVRSSPGDIIPIVINGRLTADPHSGYLCTFKPGTTYIDVISGLHRARMPITVTAGRDGLCGKALPPAPVVPPKPQPAQPAPVVPVPHPVAKPFFHPTPTPDAAGLALPPAPTPVAAPAPPASAAGARKEEEEYEYQQGEQEHDGTKAQFVAVPAARHEQAFDQQATLYLVGSALLLGLMGAMVAGSVRRQPQAAPVRVRRFGGSQ